MFDFYKKTYCDIYGIDYKKADKKNKKPIYFLSQTSKALIYIFGIIFVLIGVLNIIISLENNSTLGLIKNLFYIITYLLVMVLISIKSKKSELFGVVILSILILLNLVFFKL